MSKTDAEIGTAIKEAAEATLSYPEDELGLERGENETEEEARLRRAKSAVPDVRFDQLLGALLALVPKYRFLLPPYFLNNARALGTLEGMARTADPLQSLRRRRGVHVNAHIAITYV